MYFGELSDKGWEYSSGHYSGAHRAFDYIIDFITQNVRFSKVRAYLISKLKDIESDFDNYCDTVGMGIIPDEE